MANAHRFTRAWIAFLFTLSCTLWPVIARAQIAITGASLSGEIHDATGAPLADVVVDAHEQATNQRWQTRSDAQGRYRFLALPVGSYEITTVRDGFARRLVSLTLGLGQRVELGLTLEVAATEAVTVAAEAPVVETARTALAESVTPREIQDLPLNGRNYLDLTLLTPGASRTNTGAAQRFAETSAVPGTGISFGSQRNLSNTFVVDGLSANDDAAGLAGTFFSQDVIREFQVITSGGIAEFGRASSGVVNVVTQSGANDLSGRVYGFFRSDRFDARNPLSQREDPLSQQQYGLTLGGPIASDRTFYFGNFEQTRNERTGIITIAAANVSAVNTVLQATGYPGPLVGTGEFATGYDTTNLFGRVDHRLSDAHRLTGRYSLYDVASPNARTVGALNTESRGTSLDARDQTGAINLHSVVGAAGVNELRAQVTRSRLAAPPNDLVGPAVNISGVASFGTATFSPTARDINLYEVADSLSMQRGNHLLKAGGDVLFNDVTIQFPGALQGVYTFSTLANFQVGRYVQFQQAIGVPTQEQSNPNAGVFVQDEWRAAPGLTLNLGLRYDLQFIEDPIRTDRDNVSPRVGVAWAPGGGRTVVRASAGIYYDRIPLRAVSNALQRDGSKYKVAIVPGGGPAGPVFPDVLSAFPTNILSSITTMRPGIEDSETRQVFFQVERLLWGRATMATGYQYLDGRGLIMSRNVNVPTLTAAQAAALGVANLGRPDPSWANIGQFDSLGRSRYDGLTLSFRSNAGRLLNTRVSYTLSSGKDDSGNFFFSQPQDANDIHADWGPSDNDQRHRLTMSGVGEWPRREDPLSRVFGGFELSYVFVYTSAVPFNPQTGNDRNNDTNVNDRPAGLGRNSSRGFDLATLDVRVARRFRVSDVEIEGLVEAFNVLNRTNLQLPNATYGPGATPNPTFGVATAAGDPRQVQFGIRVAF